MSTVIELDRATLVVTGAGAGIGREVALQLLEAGARVAGVDRDPAGLEETAARAGAGERLSLHPLDITDRDAVLALPDVVLAAHGQVDGLVNVAGIVHTFTPIAELDLASIERVMAVNFWGTVVMTKAFLPHLLERPAAALVNVASMGALVPFPGQSAYGASKAAVKLFTEGLAAEHRTSALRTSIVLPGGIATDILANSGVDRPGSGEGHRLTSAADAAAQIVDAVRTGTQRVVVGRDARLIDRLSRIAPTRTIHLIASRMAR